MYNNTRYWWHMPVVPATHEAKVKGMQSETNLGKSMRLYLKKQTIRKKTYAWFKW
jgi:hypothetical protein